MFYSPNFVCSRVKILPYLQSGRVPESMEIEGRSVFPVGGTHYRGKEPRDDALAGGCSVEVAIEKMLVLFLCVIVTGCHGE